MTGGTAYLRAADIARLTGMSIRTVRRWIDDEIIPSVKLGGAGSWRRAELERLSAHPYPRPPRKTRKMTINNQENQAILALSGKHGTRTCSIFFVLVCPNDTL